MLTSKSNHLNQVSTGTRRGIHQYGSGLYVAQVAGLRQRLKWLLLKSAIMTVICLSLKHSHVLWFISLTAWRQYWWTESKYTCTIYSRLFHPQFYDCAVQCIDVKYIWLSCLSLTVPLIHRVFYHKLSLVLLVIDKVNRETEKILCQCESGNSTNLTVTGFAFSPFFLASLMTFIYMLATHTTEVLHLSNRWNF